MKKLRGQGIRHVGSLFEKYTKILRAPQGVVIDATTIIVEEVCRYSLRRDQCQYNATTQILTLRVPGMVKTEILLKKKEILRQLKEVLGEKGAPKDLL
jgi:uncharacterized Fe-S cluster-containing protein